MSTHPLYSTWQGMIDRCSNPKNPAYYNYGERGIKVCERWRLSFDDFCSDMGPRPDFGYTVDRMENDGDYEPNNCYWATAAQQAANRRPYQRRTIERSFDWGYFWKTAEELGYDLTWDCRAFPPEALDTVSRMGWSVTMVLPRANDNWGPAYRMVGAPNCTCMSCRSGK